MTHWPNQPWLLAVDLAPSGEHPLVRADTVLERTLSGFRPAQEVEAWCNQAYGRKSWFFGISNMRAEFYFEEESHVTEFLLRWSNDISS